MPTRTPAPARDTRSRLLRTTARMLWSRGYHATSVQEILSETGLPKGSLYFHFPGGKDQLVIEALRMTAQTVTEIMAEGLLATRRAGDATKAIATALGRMLESSKFARGCPVSTVMLESAVISDDIRTVCAETYDEWHGLIVSRLAENGTDPDRAQLLATLVLSSIEGALILCRARLSMKPLEDVAEQVAMILRREEYTRRKERPVAG